MDVASGLVIPSNRSLLTPEELLKLVKTHASDPENYGWGDITGDETLKKKLAKWLVEVALTQVDLSKVNKYVADGGDSIVDDMMSPADEGKATFDYVNSYDHWETLLSISPEHVEPGVIKNLPREYTNGKGRKKRAGPTEEGMRLFNQAVGFFTELRKADVYADILRACQDYWTNESEHFKDIRRRGQYRNKKKSSENQKHGEEDGEAGELDASVLQAFNVLPVDSNDDGSSEDDEKGGRDTDGK